MLKPDYEISLLQNSNLTKIVGIDEVGRGCWAGPLVMAAYAFEAGHADKVIDGVRDSKKLSEKKRNGIVDLIKTHKINLDISQVSAKEISQVGLAQAIQLATNELIQLFDHSNTYFLLDGNLKLPETVKNYEVTVKGDDTYYSIALASIYAKVFRDNYMKEISKKYPEYGFDRHVGYGTQLHSDALKKYGVTPEHRTNYKPIQIYL